MHHRSLFLNYLLAVVLLGLFTVSCTPEKNTVYFNTVPYNSQIQTLITKDFEHKVKADDVLQIGIYSRSPDVALYNTAPDGYLVDKNGNIQLYKLGDVRVTGLTLEQVKEKIKRSLVPDIMTEATVSARFRNHKIVVLGEVGTPGIIPMETEHLSLLEAISSRGDLRPTARKDNILVIRNTDRGKLFYRVNLLDGSVFNTDYYYLQADDIVYVEPEKKPKSATTDRIITYTLSGLSFLLLLYDRIRR